MRGAGGSRPRVGLQEGRWTLHGTAFDGRVLILDTETTGIHLHDDHRIVEIGCVELMSRLPTGRVFHCYINPERQMPKDAEAVHGLTDAFLADKPRFAEIVDDFLAFIEDSPLVAHNAMFDIGFLNQELGRLGKPRIEQHRCVDTLALARKRLPGAKHSLDALCTRYGVDRSGRTKHGALLDAELLAQVFVELTGGLQIGLDLAHVVVAGAANAVRQLRPSRAHAPSASELAAHAAFISRMKNPLWLSR
jgi:DNA polymerase-3 subunit epsilon